MTVTIYTIIMQKEKRICTVNYITNRNNMCFPQLLLITQLTCLEKVSDLIKTFHESATITKNDKIGD